MSADTSELAPWMEATPDALGLRLPVMARRRAKVVIDCAAEDAQRLADLLALAHTYYATKSERDRAILAACASARVEGGV